VKIGNKQLLIVGDRVLIRQETLEERSKVGLYLPQTVVAKEEVQSGRIVATGPGIPVPELQTEDEPWRDMSREPRYLPMQAEPNDYALFIKKASIEITFEGEKYLIVPHSALLVLMREAEDVLKGLEDFSDMEEV
jgi:co-chaperonin GroES (HSP10)